MSRPALRPALRPLQLVPGAFYLEVKWPEHEPDYSPVCSAEVPPRAVVVFTGTHLPLLLQLPAKVYLTSCLVVTLNFFSPGLKRPGLQSVHFGLHLIPRCRMVGAIANSIFPYIFIVGCLKPFGKFAFAVIYFEFQLSLKVLHSVNSSSGCKVNNTGDRTFWWPRRLLVHCCPVNNMSGRNYGMIFRGLFTCVS